MAGADYGELLSAESEEGDMKVTYNSVIVDGRKRGMVVNLCAVPCCERMRKACENHAIGFGEDDPMRPWLDTWESAKRLQSHIWRKDVCIYSAEEAYDGDIDYTGYKIDFCPFCGTKISVEDIGPLQFKAEKKIQTKETEEIVPLEQQP